MPSTAETLALGIEHHRSGRLGEAEAIYRRVLALEPHNADAIQLLGVIAHQSGRPEEAIKMIGEAIALNRNAPGYRINIGEAYRALGRLDEAEAAQKEALALDPRSAEALNNLGLVQFDKGNRNAAIECYRRALALRPDFIDAHRNLGLTLLALGHLGDGWREYEWRLRAPQPGMRMPPRPQWRGENLAGSAILLQAEEDERESIQFIRYAPLVATRGGRVSVEAQAELKRLFAGVPGVVQVFSRDEPLPDVAWKCPLPSLPLIFGTVADTVPAQIPYLSADPVEVGRWTSRIGEARLKVGLAWAGRPDLYGDRFRSLDTLALLAPLATIEGVTLVSLQQGAAGREAANPPPGMQLIDLGAAFRDLSDMAAAIMALDLVVATDNVAAHLAGALGKPVRVMLGHAPEWVWPLDRETTQWYPAARLFRQSTRGDWQPVIAQIADDLRRIGALPEAPAAATPHAAAEPVPDGASASDLLRALGALHQAGKIALRLDYKRLNHIDSPVGVEADSNIWAYAAILAVVLAWFAGGAVAAGVAAPLGIALYYTAGVAYVRHRLKRRVVERALGNVDLWRRLWRFGGVSLVRQDDGAVCDAPEGNWMELVRSAK
jgi:tetratricopeptide (TPR) repeat protein